MFGRVGKTISELGKRQDGSSMIEFAIVFPILLLLFAGAAEIGRLLHTYNTLAKATDVGARYLSTSRDATSNDTTLVNAAKLKAQRLVVCGYTDTCVGRTPVVTGLDVNNPQNNVLVTLPASTDTVKYVKVEIQAYSFPPGVFNLANLTGKATSTFYFSLTPATRMRYMR